MASLLAPAAAAPGDNATDLARALDECDSPTEITMTASLMHPTLELVVNCDAVIDLDGHTLTVHNVVISSGHVLEVTTATSGTLTAHPANHDVAGIQNTDAALVVSGNATVYAHSLWAAAAVGGSEDMHGGATTVRDHAVLQATTTGVGGAAVGGGVGGDGGTTTVRDHATLTAVATSSTGGAGVGGGIGGNGGTTTVTGHATLTATGGVAGAGIGGGEGRAGGDTHIREDAEVTATGGARAAGIGGGFRGGGGYTTIEGRTRVTATGGSGADDDFPRGGAGIGTGGDAERAPSRTTHITDSATVVATGRDGGAGIGGGSNAEGITTTINRDADVTAVGGEGAAGIGGGYVGNGGHTVVAGNAQVTATGGDHGAGIGGGEAGDGGSTLLTGGTVTAIPGDGPTGSGADPVGAGADNDDLDELRVHGGTLVLPRGVQRVPATNTLPTPPVFEIVAEGTVSGGPSGSAALVGDGTVLNHGALTLPTDKVGTTLVEGHHYHVTFDLNGGAGTAPAPVTVYAASFAAGDRDFPVSPTRPGHTFAGWHPARDGSGSPITATSVLPGLSTDGSAVAVTAFATWRRDAPVTAPVPLARLTNATDRGRGITDPQVGDRLEVEAPSASLRYTWHRVPADDPDGSEVDDGAVEVAQGPTYTLEPADLGHRVRVTTSAVRPPYAGAPTTVHTGPVRPAPLPDPEVAILGEPQAGRTLTATAVLPDVDGLTATWTWHTRARGAETWTLEPDHDSPSFTLTGDHVGHDVRVTLTLAAPGHLDRDDAAIAGPVADYPPLPVPGPGEVRNPRGVHPRVGQPVRLRAPLPRVAGAQRVVQWQRTRAARGPRSRAWVTIRGAARRTFVPRPRDLGRRLRAKVTITAPGHQPHTTVTAPTRRVLRGVLPPAGRTLVLRGVVEPGRVLRLDGLRAYRARLPRSARLVLTWRADGRRIAGATRRTYRVRPPHAAGRITVTVTVRAPGHRVRQVVRARR